MVSQKIKEELLAFFIKVNTSQLLIDEDALLYFYLDWIMSYKQLPLEIDPTLEYNVLYDLTERTKVGEIHSAFADEFKMSTDQAYNIITQIVWSRLRMKHAKRVANFPSNLLSDHRSIIGTLVREQSQPLIKQYLSKLSKSDMVGTRKVEMTSFNIPTNFSSFIILNNIPFEHQTKSTPFIQTLLNCGKIKDGMLSDSYIYKLIEESVMLYDEGKPTEELNKIMNKNKAIENLHDIVDVLHFVESKSEILTLVRKDPIMEKYLIGMEDEEAILALEEIIRNNPV